MSAHTFDVAELRELERALGQLVDYCHDLEAHAIGATASVDAQWSGIANNEFLGRVQTWQVGAIALRGGAEVLKSWAGDAATVYEDAQTGADRMWASA